MERLPNIRHLAALAAIVRHGSLSRAANMVNLSQPALSQAIAGLEATLGLVLFLRGPSGMSPTPPAMLLASRAEIAIQHIGSTRVTGTQVRAFLAVARAASYASAAKAVGLSSVALHRAVADLEVALGQRLIERRGRSLLLTKAGERRARGFALALAELRAGFSEVDAWQGKNSERIVIGAMPLSRAHWLPETISWFVRENPGIEIAVHEGSHAELSGPLRDGDIDFILGALRDEAEVDDLIQEPVFEDRPALIMRAGHPLLGDEKIAERLVDYPWILPSKETPLRRYWEAMFSSLGYEIPRVEIECGSVMMVRQLLRASNALTLLSPDQVSVELEAGILATLPTPVPVNRVIGISTRANWRPTRTQADFIDKLRKVGSKIQL